ncbi:MAG: hypothetical protein NZM29_05850, partial [Nitrospira sp.]|nr:hypothetical protein [Nitrospira sp.]
ELVAKDGELVLYVTDHEDRALLTEGGKAKATIQQGYEKASRVEVELQPAGDNVLKGTGTFTITQHSKIMVFIKLPDHEAHAASFTPVGSSNGEGPTSSAAKPSSHAH